MITVLDDYNVGDDQNVEGVVKWHSWLCISSILKYLPNLDRADEAYLLEKART